jgi:hypothetical protein
MVNVNDFDTYDAIFLRYVAELRAALAAARDWYALVVTRERTKGLSPKEAEASVEARWPFGPSSHPWVLGVFRKYYLITEELNARNAEQALRERPRPEAESDWGEEDLEPSDLEIEDEDSPFAGMTQVAPWILLIDSLHGRDDELVNALEFLVYRPVGLDANDNVV